jgi:hypothetical protein
LRDILCVIREDIELVENGLSLSDIRPQTVGLDRSHIAQTVKHVDHVHQFPSRFISSRLSSHACA